MLFVFQKLAGTSRHSPPRDVRGRSGLWGLLPPPRHSVDNLKGLKVFEGARTPLEETSDNCIKLACTGLLLFQR